MGRQKKARDSRWLAPVYRDRYCPHNPDDKFQSASHNPYGSNGASYGSLVRRTVLFQFRLAADGVRDLLLSPISVIAALLGLLNPSNPSWAFDRLMGMGRISDRWINLFEQEHLHPDHDRSQTMDDLVDHLEREVKARMDPAAGPQDTKWAEHLHAAFKGRQPGA